MSTALADQDVSLLARVLGNGSAPLPTDIARYLIEVEFSQRDRARMHELAVGNQNDVLSVGERDELAAYARVGTVLAILKSKARKTLGGSSRKKTTA